MPKDISTLLLIKKKILSVFTRFQEKYFPSIPGISSEEDLLLFFSNGR